MALEGRPTFDLGPSISLDLLLVLTSNQGIEGEVDLDDFGPIDFVSGVGFSCSVPIVDSLKDDLAFLGTSSKIISTFKDQSKEMFASGGNGWKNILVGKSTHSLQLEEMKIYLEIFSPDPLRYMVS